ncbi:MAG TPA: hypothetical protein QF359_01735, partial [Rhodospirillales bacterium]|nr:hypothetical protein [Rhodospirillales bacterium]
THFKIRKRARKKIDQEIFQQTVYCIISNLVLSAGKLWRIGVMGEGARPENAERVLRAIKALIS